MLYRTKQNKHPFHIVSTSGLPALVALWVFIVFFLTVFIMHRNFSTFLALTCGVFANNINIYFILFLVFFASILVSEWFYDICVESKTYHSLEVQNGLKFGMVLFITSEVMFFFGFFWAFFHCSLNPSIWIGAIWPPIGIDTLNPWGLPFLNTVLLLSSGFTLTDAHWHLLNRKDIKAFDLSLSNKNSPLMLAMHFTIFYGVFFTLFQAVEYMEAPFSINSGIYGSIFFLMTGFHGFHVFIGTLMLIVCTIRIHYSHFVYNHHVGFEASAWYWHFVDVVWIFLFIFLYWWGS